jgi:F-type H+-transporting ATPase subunit delta
LSEEQSQRLRAALGRIHHRDVQLNVTVDPAIVGGLEVRVGDEVIDGTLSTRIEAARRRLTH